MTRTVAAILLAGVIAASCTSGDSTPTTGGESLPGTAPLATSTTTTTRPAQATTTTMSVATGILETLQPPLALTPEQAEGPYYPPIKPADKDNDLYDFADAPGDPTGTELTIEGVLVDAAAQPIAEAVIQIWQTDGGGLYLHPDFDGEPLDQSFQFYGETVTDTEGFWRFRTIEPVNYESRPRHIHVKVIVDGSETLTTQIYFEGDPLLDLDRIFAGTDQNGAGLVASTTQQGSGIYATHVIVVGR